MPPRTTIPPHISSHLIAMFTLTFAAFGICVSLALLSMAPFLLDDEKHAYCGRFLSSSSSPKYAQGPGETAPYRECRLCSAERTGPG